MKALDNDWYGSQKHLMHVNDPSFAIAVTCLHVLYSTCVHVCIYVSWVVMYIYISFIFCIVYMYIYGHGRAAFWWNGHWYDIDIDIDIDIDNADTWSMSFVHF